MKKFLVILTACSVWALSGIAFSNDADRDLEKSVRNLYVFTTLLKDYEVKIDAKDGAVTLTGLVSNQPQKLLAKEATANHSGVKSVNNNLKITGGESADRADAILALNVKSMLLLHRGVNGFGTTVSADAGKVTLTGEAINKAQKQLTTEYAEDVEGVTHVKNEMTVAKATGSEKDTLGEKIDDASITAQIKVSLLFHRSTSVVKTQVKTDNGVVTLSGMAKNKAQKELVTKLVKDINGVTSVNNRMTIMSGS
jgi:osmotically-inducible protein OsmY